MTYSMMNSYDTNHHEVVWSLRDYEEQTGIATRPSCLNLGMGMGMGAAAKQKRQHRRHNAMMMPPIEYASPQSLTSSRSSSMMMLQLPELMENESRNPSSSLRPREQLFIPPTPSSNNNRKERMKAKGMELPPSKFGQEASELLEKRDSPPPPPTPVEAADIIASLRAQELLATSRSITPPMRNSSTRPVQQQQQQQQQRSTKQSALSSSCSIPNPVTPAWYMSGQRVTAAASLARTTPTTPHKPGMSHYTPRTHAAASPRTVALSQQQQQQHQQLPQIPETSYLSPSSSSSHGSDDDDDDDEDETNNNNNHNDNTSSASSHMSSSASLTSHNVNLLNALAMEHVRHAEYNQAIVIFERVLALQQLRSNQASIASAWHNLGTVHAKQAGIVGSASDQRQCRAKALKCFQTSAQLARQVLGPLHPNVAMSLVRIGLLLLESKQYQNAVHTFQEALRLRLAIYGTHHRLVANLYNNLGLCHVHLQNYLHAKEALCAALSIQRQLTGQSDQDLLELADTLFNIGGLWLEWIRKNGSDARKAAEAEEAFAEAMQLRVQVLGPDDRMVLQVRSLLDMARAIPLSPPPPPTTLRAAAPPSVPAKQQQQAPRRSSSSSHSHSHSHSSRPRLEQRLPIRPQSVPPVLSYDLAISRPLVDVDDDDSEDEDDDRSEVVPIPHHRSRSYIPALKRTNSQRKQELYGILVNLVERERESRNRHSMYSL